MKKWKALLSLFKPRKLLATRYEYTKTYIPKYQEEIETLDYFGNLGWELILVRTENRSDNETIFYFKRPIKEEST